MLTRRLASLTAASAAVALLATGCATTPKPTAEPSAEAPATGASSPPAGRQVTEAAGPTPRLAVTYDGGVLVVDARSLSVLADYPVPGFLRLNPAGDGRHVLLTEGDSFRLLDLGTWSKPHGDHSHSYGTDPRLTDVRLPGSHPGHVVTHDDRTVLFYDGSGDYEVFDPKGLNENVPPQTERHTAGQAHHGVAVQLKDDTRVETVGTEEARTGARAVDRAGKEVARTKECPGVHGEATAKNDVVALGCEDGLVIFKDGKFHKIQSPDSYGRIGNQAGTDTSTVVLGDYKVDKDAELERPRRISLTDTATGKLKLVKLPASYSFRSLGRGPKDEALVLGTDGKLHVIDPATGKITRSVAVTAPWEEPTEWQQPRPALRVIGTTGYVTEPATKTVHTVDLTNYRTTGKGVLPQAPNEIAGNRG